MCPVVQGVQTTHHEKLRYLNLQAAVAMKPGMHQPVDKKAYDSTQSSSHLHHLVKEAVPSLRIISFSQLCHKISHLFDSSIPHMSKCNW